MSIQDGIRYSLVERGSHENREFGIFDNLKGKIWILKDADHPELYRRFRVISPDCNLNPEETDQIIKDFLVYRGYENN